MASQSRAVLLMATTAGVLHLLPCGHSSTEPVFVYSGTLSLDGKTCALQSEGAAAPLPMNAEPYTLQAEILTTVPAVGSKSAGIMSWGDFSQNGVNAFRLDRNGDALQNYWFGNDLASDTSIQLHLADGQWHRVAATWDGTTQTLVADGRQVGSRKPTGKPNIHIKSNFCVGASSPQYDAKWQGQIRCVKIWASAKGLDELDFSCSAWGSTLLWLFAIGGVVYIGGGVAWGRRIGRKAAGGSALGWSSVLQPHPHFTLFNECYGLVQDGVQFSRQRVRLHRSTAGGSSRPTAMDTAALLHGVGDSELKRNGGRSKAKKKKGNGKEHQQPHKATRAEDKSSDGTVVCDTNEDAAATTHTRATSTSSAGGGRWVHVPG